MHVLHAKEFERGAPSVFVDTTGSTAYMQSTKARLRLFSGERPQSFDSSPLANVTGGINEPEALGFDDPVPAGPLIFDVGTPVPAINGAGMVSADTGNGVTTA